LIYKLLWRCPICKTDEALTHLKRRFHPDLVECTACKAGWELSRVVGGPDFRLRLTNGEGAIKDLPLAAWYDQMMADLSLEPITHPAWSKTEISRSDETLYLFSRIQVGLASSEDPIFEDEKAPPPPPEGTPLPAGMRPLGPGQLFFTSQRLVCAFINGLILDFPWAELRSADTLMDIVFNVSFENGGYGFVPAEQSVLKLLAYARLIAEKVEAESGRTIYLGYI
jgi:hypothetical protein